jgi:hypothetical protein
MELYSHHPIIEPYIRSRAGIPIGWNPEWRVYRNQNASQELQLNYSLDNLLDVNTDELNNCLDPWVSRWCLRHGPWASLAMIALLHLSSRYSLPFTLYNSVLEP